MPISETKYRLGEFMIIEHGSVLLSWVTHVAVGDQRSGKCFIIGNILFIGCWDREEVGYLKLEFHEHLMKLPEWNKTRYYCFTSSIREVGTGQSLTDNLIKRFSTSNINDKTDCITEPRTFRLGRYAISVDGNGTVSWKTVGETNITSWGTCFMESGVLFLGPQEYESDEGQSKHNFFNDLKLLPQWDRTFAWGHHGSLMTCSEPEPQKSRVTFWKSEYVKTCITNNMPFSRRQLIQKKNISEIKTSGLKQMETAWHRIIEWKGWSSVESLVITGVLQGFRFLMFIVEKTACLSSRVIERFRAHYKK